MAVNNIYSKLEQGSKGNSKSRKWYDQKTHARRIDSLLCYLHHARNSDEHTLELISGFGISGKSLQDGVTIGIDDTKTSVHIDFKEGHEPEPGSGIAQLTVGFYPRPVMDTRFNDRFDPPDIHLARTITDRTAGGIATLALKYLEALLAEANMLLSN
jgi:hypothetical protein